MPTRQQRRTRGRSAAPDRKHGGIIFVAVLTILLLAGGAAVALLRSNPPERTSGAIVGEHWHAAYRIDVCGRTLATYPHVEGDLHSHHDDLIHVHPTTIDNARSNANLGNFLQTYETTLRERDGRRELIFPDGSKFADGDTCPDGSGPYDVEVLVNGDRVEGDPSELVIYNNHEYVIRFGPEETEGTAPNPYTQLHPPAGPTWLEEDVPEQDDPGQAPEGEFEQQNGFEQDAGPQS